jgi:diguanylate cyclase (GGDEF)-like protein
MPPGWDGIETIRSLWQESPDLQVILCTAYTDYSWQDIRRIFGERDNLLFLRKPFDTIEVLQLTHALSRKWEMNHEIQGRLNQLAFYDNLTGLPNRTLFLERLTQTIVQASRYQRKAGLLFIDLDNFKRVNDTLGHSLGDMLLKAVADRLVDSLRKSDTVANPFDMETAGRLGGDEFTIILPCVQRSEDAATIAQRIAEQVGQPLILGGHEIVITPSIGIAIYPDDGTDVETLIKNADMAMYYAKRIGPNMFKYFQESMNETALQRLTIENHLRQALAHDEFSLHYQPQIELSTGKVKGMEALLRWNNWELGEVPPLDFIPIAEESGMIVEIGEWVFCTACKQFKSWIEQGRNLRRISINVSVKQFNHPDFAKYLGKVLEDVALEPHFVELEITESLLASDTTKIKAILTVLKDLGVKTAIDDFGTGYSSLSRLKEMPIDCLKIDKSFVQGIHGGARDRSIVSAIIAMAQSMGLNVIAEGVETKGQADFLKEQSCEEVQGYLFSRPMDVSTAETFLRRAFTQKT